MSKLWKNLSILPLILGGILYAQNTTVTATVVDTDGTTWINGSWSVAFTPNSNYPNVGSYTINGAPLSSSVLYQKGLLNGSGALSVVIYDSSLIVPSLSGWDLTVCPQASAKCGLYHFSSASSSMDISSQLTAVIPAPRFNAVANSYGYADVEAIATLPIGATYYNVVSLCPRTYNGTTWACPSAGAGTVTAVTGTAPVTSTGGTTPAIGMPAATGSVNGYLLSSDWNIFNGKQDALGFTAVPNTRTVNGHALSSNVTVTNSDLGAVPTTTTVNGHALSSNVTVSASDLTTGTLPHAQLPTLLSGDIPNNAANTSGTAALASNLTGSPAITVSSCTGCGGSSYPTAETHTASSSAALIFTSCFSSSYSRYKIYGTDIVSSGTNAALEIQLSHDGGATYDTGSNYNYARWLVGINTTNSGTASTNQNTTGMVINVNTFNSANYGTSFDLTFTDPNSANNKNLFGHGNLQGAAATMFGMDIYSTYLATQTINAFKVFVVGQNITSGTVTCQPLPQ